MPKPITATEQAEHISNNKNCVFHPKHCVGRLLSRLWLRRRREQSILVRQNAKQDAIQADEGNT